MTKNELLREAVYIIDHLCSLCEFIPRAVKVSGVTGNSCTKEKPLVSSSEKGKTKGTLKQQDAPIKKIRVPLHEASLAAVEHSDAVVTTIILVPDTSNDLVEAVPIQSIPTSLASLFCNLKEDWIEEIFGVVKNAVKIEDLVDVDQVKVLSDQGLICSSKIAHIEDQLNNLSSKAPKLKVKDQEVLREEERVFKRRKDLTVQQ
ncbi:hypothetical protein Cgig2_033641 [Carnegiea gigantea]|uniref:Uncharacterized protein n=1 Tax=Carnegiea gigantea TaxID=171969 RepID=A0A9Q1K489_9CARY|nr:hypothetical protein Cgig2_033641 [Carnegiea gigantea]